MPNDHYQSTPVVSSNKGFSHKIIAFLHQICLCLTKFIEKIIDIQISFIEYNIVYILVICLFYMGNVAITFYKFDQT